jgi:hypothetical protein
MDLIMKGHLYIYIYIYRTNTSWRRVTAIKIGMCHYTLPPPVRLETDIFHPTMAYYKCKEGIMAFIGVWLFCYLSYFALSFFFVHITGVTHWVVWLLFAVHHTRNNNNAMFFIADFLYDGVQWGKCSLWGSSKLCVTSLEFLLTGFSLNCDNKNCWSMVVYTRWVSWV